jgi:hypothetical protein
VQQAILMVVLATMVYSVSLDLRVADFRYVARQPVAVGIGLLAQFVLLPGATWESHDGARPAAGDRSGDDPRRRAVPAARSPT